MVLLGDIVNGYIKVETDTGIRYPVVSSNERLKITPTIIGLIKQVHGVISDLSNSIYKDANNSSYIFLTRVICIAKYVLYVKRMKLTGINQCYYSNIIRNPPQEILIKEALFVMRDIFKLQNVKFTPEMVSMLESNFGIVYTRQCTRFMSGMSSRQIGKTDSLEILQASAFLYFAYRDNSIDGMIDQIKNDFLVASNTKIVAENSLIQSLNLCKNMHENVDLKLVKSACSIITGTTRDKLYSYSAHDISGSASVRGRTPIFTMIDELSMSKYKFLETFIPIINKSDRICIALSTPPKGEDGKEALKTYLYTQENMERYVDIVDVGFVCSNCKSSIQDALKCTHRFHMIPVLKPIADNVNLYLKHHNMNENHISALEEFKGYYNPFSDAADSMYNVSTIDKIKFIDYNRGCIPINHNTIIFSIDQDGGGELSKNGVVILSANIPDYKPSPVNNENCHILAYTEFGVQSIEEIAIKSVDILVECCRRYDILNPYRTNNFRLYAVVETNHNKSLVRLVINELKKRKANESLKFFSIHFVSNKSAEKRKEQKHNTTSHISNIIFNIKDQPMKVHMLTCTVSTIFTRSVTAVSYNGAINNIKIDDQLQLKTQLKNMLINYSKYGKVSGKNKHSNVNDDAASAALIAFTVLHAIAIVPDPSIYTVDIRLIDMLIR